MPITDWAKLIAPVAAAVLASRGSRPQTPAQTLGQLPPDLRGLLSQSTAQQTALQPLKNSVNTMAYGLLPQWARANATSTVPTTPGGWPVGGSAMPRSAPGSDMGSSAGGALSTLLAASPSLIPLIGHLTSGSGATAAGAAGGLTQQGGRLVPISGAAAQSAGVGNQIGSKFKAGGVGGVLGGAQTAYDIAHGNVTGATINGAMTGFKYGGPIGAGIGASVGAVGAAIRKHMNITKGGRENFAKKHGYPDLASFNAYLRALGPAGHAAAIYGERVVGKHNTAQQNEWFALAQEALDREGQGR